MGELKSVGFFFYTHERFQNQTNHLDSQPEFNGIPSLLQDDDTANTEHEYTLDEAVHATSEWFIKATKASRFWFLHSLSIP